MSVEPRAVREDLVAVIAAGRELSPDHDYVLADVFLDRLRRDILAPAPAQSRWYDDPARLRTLLAAACLALAAMLIPFFGMYMGHADAGSSGPIIVQRGSDFDQDFGRVPPWWRDGPGPQLQSP